jgi:hypothetical protein
MQCIDEQNQNIWQMVSLTIVTTRFKTNVMCKIRWNREFLAKK